MSKLFEEAIGEIRDILMENSSKIAALGHTNDVLFKAAATAKNKLEQALKRPDSLNEAVYAAIDILREVTPYSNYGTASRIDPPLTDAEKTLPPVQKMS